MAASFDDKVKVIDTATNTIVADLSLGTINWSERIVSSKFNCVGENCPLLDIL